MKLFEKIKHSSKKYFLNSRNSSTSRFAVTPYRDWFLLIMAGVLIGFVLVSVSVYLFFIFNNNEGMTAESLQNTQFESIDESGLKSALTLFEERKNTLEKLLISSPPIVDPSL